VKIHDCLSFGLLVLGFGIISSSQPLTAQTYVTAFDDVKFNREVGPVQSFGSFVQVEETTGAIDLNIPLGPGIGARNARFQPVYRDRLQPNSIARNQSLGLATRPLLLLGPGGNLKLPT